MSLVSVTQPEMRLGTTTADKKGKGRKKSTLIKHNKSTLDITLDSLAAQTNNLNLIVQKSYVNYYISKVCLSM